MITTTILQVLHTCLGNPLAETVLLSEVRLHGVKSGEREFQSALQKLKTGGFATVSEDPLTADSLWSITKKGLSHLGVR